MKITVRQLKRLIKEQVEDMQGQGETDWHSTIDKVIKGARSIKNYQHYLTGDVGLGGCYIEDMPLSLFAHLAGITEDQVRKMEVDGSGDSDDGYGSEQLSIESTVSVYGAED